MKKLKVSDRCFYSLILLLYVFVVGVTSYFHEPWLDECQAWLIARDCSVVELFGERLHYEGHPALWFMLLMPFAKLGFPFKETMFFINLLFMVGGLLIMFRYAPFPRWIKAVLPFTYFLCYQYGVVSRPYSMMFFAFCMMALYFQDRNEKPLRFLFAQFLLCMSCAYGMLISAAICLVWTVEIIQKEQYYKKITAAFHDLRAWYLLIFLLANVFMLVCMLPSGEAQAVHKEEEAEILDYVMRGLYSFFIAIADATVYGHTLEYWIDYEFSISFAIGIVFGIILLLLIGKFAKKTGLSAYIWLPYGFLGVFGTFVYFSSHHIGIYAMLLLFYVWIIFSSGLEQRVCPIKVEVPSFMKKYIVLLVGLVIVENYYWTCAGIVMDIQNQYDFGKEVADFIKKNDAEGEVWVINTLETEDEEFYLVENSWFAVSVNAYFKQNVFVNVQEAYALNSCASPLERYEGWGAKIPPKYVLLEGRLKDTCLSQIWGEDVLKHYEIVEEIVVNRGFRNKPLRPAAIYIYQWIE